MFHDIDVLLVYPVNTSPNKIQEIKQAILQACAAFGARLDFTMCNEREFHNLKLDYDNKVKVA